ncbi:hypothetical protein [Nocardioides perillae]|uniref:Putative subunit of tRNA(5-methylaminomethyl-2-thiouridylate) methyltransferase n=1 Tax=Nocardioides perillae TaxID=1119534 RepID=A0A7Y9RTF5_9ACTN|nr:hypothetical protein [Nocardioides perillae]NYG56272.1 putative subunit of tRNA(5-methylaminomethyl-2-thiouridylate) methyltransferase [Nocardioides perillae]
MRSTVGRESTTFGFSILVTVTFGLLQSVHRAPSTLETFGYAVGAVLESLEEALAERLLVAGGDPDAARVTNQDS